MTGQEFREAVRADIARAYGPAVIRDALFSDEARAYLAARRAADAETGDFCRRIAERAQEIMTKVSNGEIAHPDGSPLLPAGYRLDWES